MRTMHQEDVDTLEGMSDLIETAIHEKKQLKKKHEQQRKEELQEKKKELKQQLRVSTRSSETSSFMVIPDDSPKAAEVHSQNLTNRKKKQPENSEEDLSQLCYCGMPVRMYISRQAGLNFERRFVRCPKTPGGNQCHFFQWIEKPKSEQYKDMTSRSEDRGNPSPSPVRKTGKNKKKSSKQSSSDNSEGESTQADNRPSSSSARVPGTSCQHYWNRRGTNAYQKVKTCRLCGEKNVTIFKTGEVRRTWVDPAGVQ